MSLSINGPRAACSTLGKLADDIGDPIIKLVNDTSLSVVEKAQLKDDIEAVLIDVFLGPKVNALRSYVYEQWRIKEALR